MTAEEVGQPSRDNFLPIRFFAQHANGGPQKSSKSESSGSIFWFSVVCVQRIETHPNGLMWRYSFLRSQVFKGEFVLSADFFLCFEGPSNSVCFSCVRCDVFKLVFCFFFPRFLRPIFAFSCSLFIRLSIGTVAPGRPRDRFWDIYGWKRTILSGSNEKLEVNMVIFVMFRGSMCLQIRTFVCFRDLRFQVLLLVLNRDRYFHLLWRQIGDTCHWV